jgi:hypothetical protein
MRLWKNCLAHRKSSNSDETDPDLVKCVQLCLAYTATVFRQDSIEVESCIGSWIEDGLLAALFETGRCLEPDLVSVELSRNADISAPWEDLLFLRDDIILEQMWHVKIHGWVSWGTGRHMSKDEDMAEIIFARGLDYFEATHELKAKALGSIKTCHFSRVSRSRAPNIDRPSRLIHVSSARTGSSASASNASCALAAREFGSATRTASPRPGRHLAITTAWSAAHSKSEHEAGTHFRPWISVGLTGACSRRIPPNH